MIRIVIVNNHRQTFQVLAKKKQKQKQKKTGKTIEWP